MSIWPPPDLESIKELVRTADVEGLIEIHGAPSDEYDTEAEALYIAIAGLAASDITADKLLPGLESIWRRNFIDDDAELALRRPAILGLAQQIARFFGPESQPLARNRSQ
jgi:hypothetical protein